MGKRKGSGGGGGGGTKADAKSPLEIAEENNNTEEPSSSSSSVASVPVGTCVFPMSRVWRLVRSEGGNNAITEARTSNDAVFLINKAAEMFLNKITEDAYVTAKRDHKNYIAYRNLSSVVAKAKKYDFLTDFVPKKARAEDALKVMT